MGASVIRAFIHTPLRLVALNQKHLPVLPKLCCETWDTYVIVFLVVNILSISLLVPAWLSIKSCHLFILFKSWNKTVWCHFYSLSFLQNLQQFCGKKEPILLTMFTLDFWGGVEFTQELLIQRVGTHFWESLTSVLFYRPLANKCQTTH